MKLQVLMSTYNGEKYLREQLDSILSQTLFRHSDWETELVVRDDGSTDRTCEILAEYAHKFPEITYRVCENIGVIASFFDLIQSTPDDVDFVALSDQDDVWFEDKLECAVNALCRKESGKPLLYCSMVQPVDEQLNPVKGIFFDEKVQPAFGNALVENICTGCTAVCNRELIRLIRRGKPEFTPMHDWWLYLAASCLGEVVYDAEPHMYYRQHAGNTVGVRRSYVSEFWARVKRYRKNRYQISRQVKSLWDFVEANGFAIENKKKEWMHEILASRKQMKARFRMVGNREVYRQRKMDDFIFRLIFLTGTV